MTLKRPIVNRGPFDPLIHMHEVCPCSVGADHGMGTHRSESMNNLHEKGPKDPSSYCLVALVVS